ncbi:MAG: hypothetical protein WA021_02700, partial [Minisyncoccia bacterium]
VEDYSRWDKALILYNHLYFLGLGDSYVAKIREDGNYWKIIDHENYNPRLIEFATDPLRVSKVDPENYVPFILGNLDNPSDVWRDSYLTQIDEYSRFVLQTLFSLGENVTETELASAFDSRLDFEIRENGFKRETSVFALRVKHLLGSFLKSERRSGNLVLFNFFNPSIVDFLINFLNQNPDEKWRILQSAKYDSQLTTSFGFQKEGFVEIAESELETLLNVCRKKETELENFAGGSAILELLLFYIETFPFEMIEEDLARHLGQLDLQTMGPLQPSQLTHLLSKVAQHESTRAVVIKRWEEIINWLFEHSYTDTSMEAVLNLFDPYKEDYVQYVAEPENNALVKRKLEEYWSARISDIRWSGEEVSDLTETVEIEDVLNELYDEGNALNKKFGFEELSVMDQLFDIDADEIADSNSEKVREEDEASDYFKDEYYQYKSDEKDLETRINELFQ